MPRVAAPVVVAARASTARSGAERAKAGLSWRLLAVPCGGRQALAARAL